MSFSFSKNIICTSYLRGLSLRCSSVQGPFWKILSHRNGKSDVKQILGCTYMYKNGHTTKPIFHQSIRSYQYSTSEGSQSKKVSPLEPPHPTLLKRLTRIEDSMRYHGYSTIRIGLTICGIAGIGIYIFREYIRENVAGEVSSVASRSLGDETVKMKANELAMALLNELLDDVNLRAQAVCFLEDIIGQKETKQALIQLLTEVLNDSYVQDRIMSALKRIITVSFKDEEFRQHFVSNLKELMQHPNIQAGASDLIRFAFESDEIKNVAKEFFQDVLASEQVKNEAANLGKTVVSSVVADNNVQQKAGDAMWSAFTYSVKPRWFSGKSIEDSSVSSTNVSNDK